MQTLAGSVIGVADVVEVALGLLLTPARYPPRALIITRPVMASASTSFFNPLFPGVDRHKATDENACLLPLLSVNVSALSLVMER